MTSRTKVTLVWIALGAFASSGCSEGTGDGDSGAGGASDGDQSSAGGGVSSSGAESQGGAGGCPSPPTDGTCEALSTIDLCQAEGCTWIMVLSRITVDEAGVCDFEDSSMCLPFDACAPRDRAGAYFKGEEVLQLDAGCALEGWTPCGSSSDPAGCSCSDRTVVCE